MSTVSTIDKLNAPRRRRNQGPPFTVAVLARPAAAGVLDSRPGRRAVVTDDDNFPTDRYVLEGLAAARGLDLRVVPTDLDSGLSQPLPIDRDVALVCLSHLAYRSGARADMVAITR